MCQVELDRELCDVLNRNLRQHSYESVQFLAEARLSGLHERSYKPCQALDPDWRRQESFSNAEDQSVDTNMSFLSGPVSGIP